MVEGGKGERKDHVAKCALTSAPLPKPSPSKVDSFSTDYHLTYHGIIWLPLGRPDLPGKQKSCLLSAVCIRKGEVKARSRAQAQDL